MGYKIETAHSFALYHLKKNIVPSLSYQNRNFHYQTVLQEILHYATGLTCIGDMNASPAYVTSKHAVNSLTRTFGTGLW